MKLNGIQAEPGTVVGVELRSLRFVVAEEPRQETEIWLRYATAEEVQRSAFMHEPRSVAEHHGIQRRMSVYGLIRQFKPQPVRHTVVRVEAARDMVPPRRIRRAARRYQ